MKNVIAMLLALTCLTLVAATSTFASGDIYIQTKVFIEEKSDWLELKSMNLDIISRGKDYIEIITHSEQLSRIRELGIKTEIVHDDVTAFLQSRLEDKPMGAYLTLAEIYSYIDSIQAEHPSLVSTKVKIGETYEGRDMWAFKVSDNPNLDEDEPEVLYDAAIHAREVITPLVLIHFINHMVDNYGTDPVITDIVDNREMWFILVCNPDGYYYNEVTDPNGGGMWRKNRRPNGDGSYGVDLNRNFGYQWGYDDEGSDTDPYSETYRGASAFSEPEAQNLRDFALSHEFVISNCYHSHSNLILWPWGYDKIVSEDEDIFTVLGDSMATWNNYDPGPIWILYVVNGGTIDWLYGEDVLKPKTFALSFEVGSSSDNFWPPSNRIQPLVEENLGPNIYMAQIAGHIYTLRAPDAPIVTVADTVSSTAYTVAWSHTDTLNPAVEYELSELQGYNVISNRGNNFFNMTNNDFQISTTRYVSPSSSFYSGSGDDFARYMQTTEPYLVQAGDSLTMSLWYDIETDWDYAYVEVSTEGTVFTPIGNDITTNSDPNGNNRGNGITGVSSGGWIDTGFDLSDYIGDEVFFRFSYYTDSYVNEEGIYIDNFYPHITFTTETPYTGILDTSYTFTSQDTGTYFYKVRAIDAEDQIGSYSALSQTVVIANISCGDASGDGELNLGDAVFLLNYVFRSGPAPLSSVAADANGDGSVNIADGIYIINFVFKGGPSPSCP